MLAVKRLLLASNNPGKLRELRTLLHDLPLQLVSPPDLDLALDVSENGATFDENARLKAQAFARMSGLPALADDSGLCVDALDGAPGVLSRRLGPPELDDEGRTRLLLQKLENVPPSRRSAHFMCAVALATPDGLGWTVEGRVDGVITTSPRGKAGFGYDPVFLVPALGRTFAELTSEEKDALSHRGRAVRHAKRRLQESGWLLE